MTLRSLLSVLLVLLGVVIFSERGCPAVAPTNPPPGPLVGRALPMPVAPRLAIVGALSYKPHQLVRLAVAGAETTSSIEWDIFPQDRADAEEVGAKLYFTAPPGRYSVVARVADIRDGRIVKARARATVVILGEPGPSPAKPPSPANPPAPPSPPAAPSVDPRAATARLVVGRFACTITPVAPVRSDGRIDFACAAHCVPGVGSRGIATFPDGFPMEVVCTAHSGTFGKASPPDVCWFTSVVPKVPGVPLVHLAKAVPPLGRKVWQNGYGEFTNRKVLRGTLRSHSVKDGMLGFDLFSSRGDSGGGIFDEVTGELLATVCCGPERQPVTFGGSCLSLAATRPAVGPLPRRGPKTDRLEDACGDIQALLLGRAVGELLSVGPSGELPGVVPYTRQLAADDLHPDHPIVRQVREQATIHGATSGGAVATFVVLVLRILEGWLRRRSSTSPPPPTSPVALRLVPSVN